MVSSYRKRHRESSLDSDSMVSSHRKRQKASSNSKISTHLRHSDNNCDYYTTRLFGRSLDVTVTSNSRSVKRWFRKINYLLRYRFRGDKLKIIGFGMQWRPQYNPRPATIQICIGHRVLIFQLLGSYVPNGLYAFLSDPWITVVGYNIGYDCRLLSSYDSIKVTSTVELRSVTGMGTASMEKMAERFLGFSGVEKPRWIGISDWEAPELSVYQVQYAALDAYISFQLGVKLVVPSDVECDTGSSDDSDFMDYY